MLDTEQCCGINIGYCAVELKLNTLSTFTFEFTAVRFIKVCMESFTVAKSLCSTNLYSILFDVFVESPSLLSETTFGLVGKSLT